MKGLLFSLVFLMGASNAYGQFEDTIFLQDFDQQDFNDVSKDLTGAFSFTTNSGGSSLGKLWGVELGLVLGVTDASNIERIARENTGDDEDLGYIPSGGLIAGVALPFGIGLEANIIPELDVSDVSISNFAIAARWEITDMIPLAGSFSPLKLALRASYGNANFNYEDSTESADIDIENTEIAAIAGFNLFLVEPYVSLSHLRSSTDLDAESNSIIPAEVNLDSNLTATKFTAGVLFKLTILRLGLEYATFDTGVNRYTAKLSFKI